jgi:hypothetical protein
MIRVEKKQSGIFKIRIGTGPVYAVRGMRLAHVSRLKFPNKMNDQQTPMEEIASGISRRRFFGLAGALAGAGLIVGATGCKKDDDDSEGVNLGSGDTGVLNYAYALEQLEAAFYIRVVSAPFVGASQMELTYLADIRDHEVAHREFFKNALGSNAIGALEPDFGSIDFSNRNSVLSTAKAFEDLGVSAYNGAGKLFSTTAAGLNYLTLAGKIVSVEARHAAVIRDMISNGSFANAEVVSETTGLDVVRTPAEVLAIAGTYIKTKINASNLPTS